ncbi:YggT family protein [Aestuariirhabdus litorea]|uniref:YggT family protein n=1 Tax=Aestuariirhabdus litorea TaxID=2528527 RepID=A0A3P3VM22_9GAMM|nr:YggT family protein [Aestuariirhabdus litorea]RRJ82706.1 YggT family protein [Aestuariirhabdus litorea]RWW92866.1 YggT family protein [Endozoicomonadaceae bacterium GTF-13]
MSAALQDTLSFLIHTIGGLYIMVVLIRFILQLVRADFYNPLSQFVVKATNPLLIPLRRLIPGVGGVDIASLALALLLQLALVYLLFALKGMTPPLGFALVNSLYELINTVLNLYLWSLIIIAIASWVAPGSYHPALMLLHQITEPLSSRVRRVIPPIGGLDLSLMAIVLIIISLQKILPAVFQALLG